MSVINLKQKRAIKRRSISMVAKFFCKDSFHYGLVTNISKKGMCINTGTSLPCGTRLKLLLPFKDKDLEIQAEVSKAVETDGFYDILEVELLKTPQKYLKFLDSLKYV
jgi:hypothetical protein